MGGVSGFGDVYRWAWETIHHPTFDTEFGAAVILLLVTVGVPGVLIYFALVGGVVIRGTYRPQDETNEFDGRTIQVNRKELPKGSRPTVPVSAQFTSPNSTVFGRLFGLNRFSIRVYAIGRRPYEGSFAADQVTVSEELAKTLKDHLRYKNLSELQVQFNRTRNPIAYLFDNPVREIRISAWFALWTSIFSTAIAIILTKGLHVL